MQQSNHSDALSQGMAAARAGRWEEARNLFFDVIDRDSSNLDAWLWLGAIAEDPEESVAFLRRALEINPRSVRAQKGMEWAQERLAARTALAPAQPGEPAPTVLPGVDTTGMEPLTRPLSTYAQPQPGAPTPPAQPEPAAVEPDEVPSEPLDWDSIVARLRTGGEETGPPPAASSPRAASSPPAAPAKKDVSEMLDRGKQQLEAGQIAEAIESLQTVVGARPDVMEAHEQLGMAYYQAGRPTQALEEFQAVVRLRPEHAEAHANIGFLCTELGRSAEAIAALRAAIGYKPDLVEALVSLGDLLRAENRLDEAIEAWERALALHPELSNVRASLEQARSAQRGGA